MLLPLFISLKCFFLGKPQGVGQDSTLGAATAQLPTMEEQCREVTRDEIPPGDVITVGLKGMWECRTVEMHGI